MDRTTASVVMPSASPSKLRMIRWRSDGQRDGPDVVDRDVEPAVEQGVDLAGRHERLRAARRAAVADVLADELRGARLVRVRRGQHADGVGGHVRRDRDGPGEALHLDDLGRRADLAGGHGLGAGRPVHDRDEVLLGREGDHDLEQEPVELGLGQRVGALHLERVLRGEHEERRLEREPLAGDRDLVLLHRLEQARLGLGRGAVDLVGEDEVREDRAGLEAEDALAALLDEDVRAGDVGRHQVGRELDAVERAVDDVGDGPDEHRLAEPGHALEQHVAVGEEAGQRLADELALADDDAADLALDGLGALGERLGCEGRRGRGGGRSFHGGLRMGRDRLIAAGRHWDGSSELK